MKRPTRAELRARAEAGFAFLKKQQHVGVERLLDIPRNQLNMVNACDCVLGHLFGRYQDGMTVFGLGQQEAIDYGFYLSPSAYSGWSTSTNGAVTEAVPASWHRDYAYLESCWVKLLDTLHQENGDGHTS